MADINNSTDDTLVTGTSDADSIYNGGLNATQSTPGQVTIQSTTTATILTSISATEMI